MSGACPTEDELIALFDEGGSAELRSHLVTCPECRDAWTTLERIRVDLAAPPAGDPAAVDRILARLEAAPRAPARLASRRNVWLGAGAGALAVAAGVLLFAPWSRDGGEVAARGAGHERSLRRDVGVTVLRAGDRLTPVRDGDVVESDTAFTASYKNVGRDGSAFVMVFAVDSAGALHWILPAYLDAHTDPAAVRLAHTDDERVLPGAMVLERPALGRLQILSFVSSEPVAVSRFEALPAAELAPEKLRVRFPGAEIDALAVVVR